ncbi:MAG TPA: cystathionine beta-lyase [Caulobacteraceae bacterium]|jgi:cystathionine beta-lyase|nr:cystathionine beta-lyase [Caulobacteraceae bacterium]
MSGKGPATRVIHAARGAGRTVGPAVEKGSTVIMPTAEALYDERQVTYGRAGLAVQDTLVRALAELEGAEMVRLFPSGLAAVTGAMLAVLEAGDEILVTDAVYKPTRRFCSRVLTRLGVATRYFAPAASPAEVLALASPATRMIVLESPGSLTFEMQDIAAIAALARERGILTLMDNTWAAGFWFKPLAHGVDLSVQALTKYVGGHSDVFMGSVATRDPSLGKAMDEAVIDFGWSVGPDDAYQILRGLRTLPTRLARHHDSGLAVARWLVDQPRVAEVLYPSLPGAPGYDLWKRDYSGAAGLFSVVLEPCPQTVVRAFLDALRLFRLGFSWGGFESLALNGDPQFAAREWPPSLAGPVVRLSIGLEDPADLIDDLAVGLAAL